MNKLVKASVMGVMALGLFGGAESASAVSIKNLDHYAALPISVSQWGHGGGTSVYYVNPMETERWDRTASRGVLLVTHNNNKTYFLPSDFYGYSGGDHNTLHSRLGKAMKPINTDQPSGTSGKITVKNNSGSCVKVSINKWERDGSGVAYAISPGATESWNRNDYRGYVLEVDGRAFYYVKPGVNVQIDSSGPTVNGKHLERIYQGAVQ